MGAGAPFWAASISARTMRPFGPLPFNADRSMPACAAIRRARGDAKILSPFAVWPFGPGDRAGVAGAGGEATAGAGAGCAIGVGADAVAPAVAGAAFAAGAD